MGDIERCLAKALPIVRMNNSIRLRDWLAHKDLREEEDRLAQAPVASLMYEEVERRIDVFIFRCCFTHSVYEARRLVIHGGCS